jgi:hypothetical protein
VSGWFWVLLWLIIISGTIVVLFRLGTSLWHQAVALGRELSLASERVEALTEELAKLEIPAPEPPEPAIFASPAKLRLERARQGGGRGRGRGRALPWHYLIDSERSGR